MKFQVFPVAHALRRGATEFGGSIVMFVAAVPVLLVFMCAVVDIGRIIVLHAALDDAAHAIAQKVAVSPVLESNDTKILKTAFDAAPALAAQELQLDVKIYYEDAALDLYVGQTYDASLDSFVEYESPLLRQQAQVELKLTGSYLTVLGSVFSNIDSGNEAEFLFESKTTTMLDDFGGVDGL